jgi:large subunit ribosomal protein L31
MGEVVYYIPATEVNEFVQGAAMKDGIHPEYKKAIVTCVCGNIFETRSTTGNLKIEICSACHPFFTGRQKLVDSAGRVERYNKKYSKKPAAAPAA